MSDTEIIDNIIVPDGRRKANPDRIKALAASMADIGLRTPITLYVDEDDRPVLVAGLHRLRAAQHLGWETIPITWFDADAIDRELWEIDENLQRSELTELERSECLARRKELWGARKRNLAESAKFEGRGNRAFAKETELNSGIPQRRVNEITRRAEALPDDIRDDIRDTPAADKGVELDALARMQPAEQREAVDLYKSGKAGSIREAGRIIREEPEPATKTADDVSEAWRQSSRICEIWSRTPPEERAAFCRRLLPYEYDVVRK